MRRVACSRPRRAYSTAHEPAERVRCFALPLLAQRWAFYPDSHHAHTTDLFGGAKHKFTGRIGKLFDRARSEWEECVHAPSGTIRHRLFQASVKLQARIDPREILCRALVPHNHDTTKEGLIPTTDVTLLYPLGANSDVVKAAFIQMMLDRVTRHTVLKWGSVVLLPLTLSMGVLPGPNVFFAWNLVRLWAHYRAEKGARAALAGATTVEMQPSEEMRTLMGHEGDASEEAIMKIEQRFDLPALQTYMQRMRERFVKEQRPST